MPYLQCPECRLTVPSAAYYLRGDECPRCLATMVRRPTFRSERAEDAEPQSRSRPFEAPGRPGDAARA